MINSFHLFYKLNQSVLLLYKKIESFLLCWSFLAFRYFFYIYKFTIKFIFCYIANFFPNVIYLSKHFSSFIIKHINLDSSKYLLYILISEKKKHKGLFFLIIIVNNEIFKIFFTKRKLIRYYYFINTYIFYQNRAFILMKFVFFNFSVINF